MKDLCVLLATHNGETVLPRTLDGYVALDDQDVAWSIIVVDNGSTDATPEILKAYTDKLPLIILSEAEPGKNRALNHGLTALDSECVVITDDDAIPHSGFLSDWAAAFARYPDAGIFGGSITPVFDVSIPDWMAETKPHFEELYARREGIADGAIGPDWIFGPNMAARRNVLETVGFDDSVGPNGSQANYAMGSETDFCRRAKAAGFSLVFASKPHVSHIVREHQTKRDFFKRRAYRLGLGTARKHWVAGEVRKTANTGIRALAARCARYVRAGLLLTGTLSPMPANRFDARWEHAFFSGYQEGIKNLRRQHAEAA